jgi:hypothetical protein
MAGIEAKTCVGKLLVHLKYGECKFAVGEDEDGRHLFCAAETQEGQSYCCDHRIIAFQYAPEPRRRSFEDADARLLLSRQATGHIYQLPSLPQVRRAAVSRVFDRIQPAPQIEGAKSRPFVSPFAFERIFERAAENHPLPPPFKIEKTQTRTEKTRAALELDPPSPKPKFPKVSDIQKACGKTFGVSVLDIISERRIAAFVEARQVAIYLCRVLTPHSYEEIGRRFGGKDHTTILYAARKIERRVKDDPSFFKTIAVLTTKLQASVGKTKTREGTR